jgi:DNA-directed RNA polymerase subunit RPC12/RpoP
MKSKQRDDLLHRIDPPEPRLIYRYTPVRAITVMVIFLSVIAAACVFLLPAHSPVILVPAIFAVILLYKLLKSCAVKIWLDWPNIIYRYRSLFRRIHEVIPAWEISGTEREITSMWRGNISERLVLEVGDRKYVITPCYSDADTDIALLTEELSRLPSTRKQAEYEIELERRIRDEKEGKMEEKEAPKELVWCMLEMSIECPRCDLPVVVNGPFTDFECPECSAKIEMTHEIWADLLEDVRDEIADDLEQGEGGKSTIWGTYNTNLYYGRLNPYCPQCKRDFDVEKEFRDGDSITCPDCGKKTPAMRAPEWFDRVFKGAVYIVGAMREQSAEPEEKDADSPVSFPCSNCGASIQTRGEERNVKCEHCGTSIYLPDDLWNYLHPAPKKQRWFVGFVAEINEFDDD